MRVAGQQDDMFLLTENDMFFHRCICRWSGSNALLRAWYPLYSQIQRFVVTTHKDYFNELTDIADTHLPIVAAMKARNEAEAVRLIQGHVMLIWSRIEQTKQTSQGRIGCHKRKLLTTPKRSAINQGKDSPPH